MKEILGSVEYSGEEFGKRALFKDETFSADDADLFKPHFTSRETKLSNGTAGVKGPS